MRDLDRLMGLAPPWLLDHTRRAAWILLALGIFAFLIVGANRPANPHLVPPQGVVNESVLSAFGAASVTVAAGPGLTAPALPRCALLAQTPTQRAQGLMGQTSLHGFAGMIFKYDQPSQDLFRMKDTSLPLSIAWFDSGGRFLAALDMTPCPATADFCRTYSAGLSFKYALEVPKGGLAAMGIGPGSTVQLSGPCTG